MKFAVAWMSIADGATGMRIECARSSISCSTIPDAPAGASMINCSVLAGTCICTVRRPVFCGAALAPWILAACSGRCRSQLRLEPCGS